MWTKEPALIVGFVGAKDDGRLGPLTVKALQQYLNRN